MARGRRTTPSLLLDTRPRRGNGGGGGDTGGSSSIFPVSWTYGRVTALPTTDKTLPAGWIEVGIPYDGPVTHAVGESDGIATWLGARVLVILDTTGRVVKISDPIMEPGKDDKVEHLGHAGRTLKAAMDDAVNAKRAADEVRERARKAQNAAENALKEAGKALTLGQSNRKPEVSPTAPADPVKGMIWYQTRGEDGAIIGAKVWDGEKWLPLPIVAERVLVPGSVGNVSLQDGAVTARTITASEELSAKVAAFLQVTTEMLTAGNATITGKAVVGDLIGNRLIGGEISLLDSEPAPQKQVQSFDDGSPHGWYTGDTRKTLRIGDGAMTITLTGDLPNPKGENITFQMAMHRGAFGPSNAAGPIVLAAAVTPSWSGTVRLRAVTNEGQFIDAQADCAPGQKITLTLTIPEGQFLSQAANANLSLSGTTTTTLLAGTNLAVDEVRADWRILRGSGLRIHRTPQGVAQITITDREGGTSVLDTKGVSYTPPGGGETWTDTWATFVRPPLASFISDGNPRKLTLDKWTRCALIGNLMLRGGITMVNSFLIVPRDGYYRIDAGLFLRDDWHTTGGVAASINTDINAGVSALQTLNNGQWTSIRCSGIRRLKAGDQISVHGYANKELSTSTYELSVQYVSA